MYDVVDGEIQQAANNNQILKNSQMFHSKSFVYKTKLSLRQNIIRSGQI